MSETILLRPEFKSVIWGGNSLKTRFGLNVPTETTGEDWTVSAHPDGDCEIINEPYKGSTLNQIWIRYPKLFGYYPGTSFPLLVKIIDAREDLSIQCHPDNDYARKYEDGALGKSECWYVIDAEPGTTIITGHSAETEEELNTMIDNGEWDKLLVEKPVYKGDFFMIEPGTLHAIKGGTLIYELQQSSTKTYRIYDYDRLQNGVFRELHTRKAKDVLVCPSPETLRSGRTISVDGGVLTQLIRSEYFSLDKLDVHDKASIPENRYFTIITVIDGEGTVNGESVRAGMSALVSSGNDEITVTGPAVVIIGKPEK